MAHQPVTALVVAAERPLDNRLPRGRSMDGAVWILVNTTPALVVMREFRLDREHWLVAGMQIPVMIDFADPSGFEIDWAAIPGIEQRVAEQDRTLADPIGTHRGVLDTLVALRVRPPDERMAAMVREAEQTAAGLQPFDRTKELTAMIEELSPPPGRLAAAVVVATAEQTLEQYATGEHTYRTNYRYHRVSSGTHRAVLAVYVPGRRPYAIYVPKFHRPKDAKVPQRALAIPAYVSASDPGDVDVRWDEAAARVEVERKWQRDLAAGRAMPMGFPTTGLPNPPALTPEQRAATAQQVKQMLPLMPAAARQLLIEQYRAAGIELE